MNHHSSYGPLALLLEPHSIWPEQPWMTQKFGIRSTYDPLPPKKKQMGLWDFTGFRLRIAIQEPSPPPQKKEIGDFGISPVLD